MVFSIVSSYIFVDQTRRLVEVIPDHLRKEWIKWLPRVLVVLSLAVQIALISTGNRRKYISQRRVRSFIWAFYMSADWIATVAISQILDSQDNSNQESRDLNLMAFWAPFLLHHLGGPDNVTDASELWLKNLLGLVYQTAAAIYITLLAWDGTLLSFLTIPMLLCGFIKYGEKTFVGFMSTNQNQFQDLDLNDADPGPSYANFVEMLCLKEAEGYHVTVEEGDDPGYDLESTIDTPLNVDGVRRLHIANYFFETQNFKQLFVGFVLGFQAREKSQAFFGKQDYKTAFEVIEVELGFAYDVFYTKAPIIYTPLGLFSRLLTSFLIFAVFLTFTVSIDVKSHRHQRLDVVITYILLIGAMFLETYAVGSLLLSDWANLWLYHNSSKILLLSERLAQSLRSINEGRRWSNSMYQYNLLNFCLDQNSSVFKEISRFIPLNHRFKNLWYKLQSLNQLKHVKVSPELKSFIFKHYLEKSRDTDLDLNILLTCRGAVSLRKHSNYGRFKWTVDVEFDHSILIWHIATDLCYNFYMSKTPVHSDSDGNDQEMYNYMIFSKNLADYMLYLLIMCPFMLPIGIGILRFKDTCAEASVFFKQRCITSKLEGYEILGKVDTRFFPSTVKGDRSKSTLFEGCKLAASLNEMGDPINMWRMVADVWVEILGYAASQCRGFDHAQQLEKGGELLTHVWFLMAHLGMNEHFRIYGYQRRVKLAIT